jgi:DNA polymerase-3 subunit delta'
MEAIGVARERIDANVAPALAMEALLIRASRSEVPA